MNRSSDAGPIRWIGDGVFVNSGPIGTGGVTRLGRTAVLRSGGVDVIVCERRVQVLDPAIFPAVGIDPRGGIGPGDQVQRPLPGRVRGLASAMIEAGGPGVSSGDLRRLSVRRRPPPNRSPRSGQVVRCLILASGHGATCGERHPAGGASSASRTRQQRRARVSQSTRGSPRPARCPLGTSRFAPAWSLRPDRPDGPPDRPGGHAQP